MNHDAASLGTAADRQPCRHHHGKGIRHVASKTPGGSGHSHRARGQSHSRTALLVGQSTLLEPVVEAGVSAVQAHGASS